MKIGSALGIGLFWVAALFGATGADVPAGANPLWTVAAALTAILASLILVQPSKARAAMAPRASPRSRRPLQLIACTKGLGPL